MKIRNVETGNSTCHEGKEMQLPIRVLHVLGGTSLGGAESRIMDLYRNMDRDRIQFDFMVHNETEDHYNQEIRALGGNIYRMPRFKLYNSIAYCRAWKAFFREHQEFQAVHGHMTSTASLYLPIASKYGVPMTIAHARSAGTDPGAKGIITKILRSSLAKRADYCFSCSPEASVAVFGKRAVEQGRVRIIPNAIDVDKFQYDDTVRQRMRQQYKLGDRFVIGHVGRFHYAKNHAYLLDVFHEVLKAEPDAVLLLVGEGPLMASVKDKAKELGIEKSVLYTGNQAAVQDYYQMMDYLVFPSRFEGLPGTVVEAQASGLRCLISDSITREVMATPLVQMLSIERPVAEWTQSILQNKTYERNSGNSELLKQRGFDVREQAEKLSRFYLHNLQDPQNLQDLQEKR
ncbi:MAG: glycosyltransferase family 1 protein [Lachnospiraceae bacterium]|nr:glycosyltransferase family 1 protein [Lachnospiraceae bacterium]